MGTRKTHAIRRAAEIAGGPAALSRVAGVSMQQVSHWLHGRSPVPARYAPAIERATGIASEQICPEVPWSLIRSSGKRAPA